MNSKNIEIVKLAEQEQKSKPISKKEYDRKIIQWQIFFLCNLNIFVKEVLGIKLHFFQEQLLLEMWDSERFAFIGSRGIGKKNIA